MTLSFTPDHAEASLTYEKAMRDRNRLLKDQISDPHWYTALESQMAESGAIITANREAALSRLAEALFFGEVMLTTFYELLTTLIGPSLTARLLSGVWEPFLSDPPSQEHAP